MDEILNVDSCPICLEELSDGHITPCKHLFCKRCIVEVFMSEQDNICPLCRSKMMVNELKSTVTNKSLIDPLKVVGSVYVQAKTVGLASYHFDSKTDCYISYSNPLCSQWPSLDSGERPPHKKPFVNIFIDEEKHIFCGEIDWSPTTWGGNALWSYEMHFSEDYDSIISGQCVQYDSIEKTNNTDTFEFGVRLVYKRNYKYDFFSFA